MTRISAECLVTSSIFVSRTFRSHHRIPQAIALPTVTSDFKLKKKNILLVVYVHVYGYGGVDGKWSVTSSIFVPRTFR